MPFTFKANLAGLELEHPLMNAAGTVKTIEDAEKVLRSAVSALVIGSITMEPRPGNTGNVYHADEVRSLNSLGLPNPGREYWRFNLSRIVEKAHRLGKPVTVSVAGFTPEEYGLLAETMFAQGADAVELNLGCPNIWDGEGQKRIPSFDPQLVASIVAEVSRVVGGKPAGVKLSPFFDPSQLQSIAQLIKTLHMMRSCLRFVTTSNTVPNSFAYDETGKPRITPGGGLAGMGGPALKPIALGQVRQFREVLPHTVQIVGAGGVRTGRDVAEYLRAGAVAVQTATEYLEHGEQCFSRILGEFIELSHPATI